MKRTILALWEYSFYKGYVSGDQLERVKMLETDVAPVAKIHMKDSRKKR